MNPNPFPPRARRAHLHPAALALAAAGLLLQLGGCALPVLVVGGAAAGGAMVGLDRRPVGAQVDDEWLELQSPRLVTEAIGDRGHVDVTSYNRIVLLTGEVPDEPAKLAVEQHFLQAKREITVINELAVSEPSSVSARSNDALITTKVKATLLESMPTKTNAIKVVTERGIVYLMGIVTAAEADRAAESARAIPGVQRVVRVFEIGTAR